MRGDSWGATKKIAVSGLFVAAGWAAMYWASVAFTAVARSVSNKKGS
jgi:hypothetical protein